jgi:hypothetical protein
MKSKNTLELVLKRKWFELMIDGKKKIEIRTKKKYWESRLVGKNFDLVKFRNGYKTKSPFFICKFIKIEVSKKDDEISFEGEIAKINKGDFIIFLGDIIEKGNL